MKTNKKMDVGSAAVIGLGLLALGAVLVGDFLYRVVEAGFPPTGMASSLLILAILIGVVWYGAFKFLQDFFKKK